LSDFYDVCRDTEDHARARQVVSTRPLSPRALSRWTKV